MYLTSKNVVQKNNQLIRNSNSFLVVVLTFLLYIMVFKVVSIFQSAALKTFILGIYLALTSVMCFVLVKYNKQHPSYFGLTMNNVSTSIKEL